MNRITPERVIQAYRQHPEIKPERQVFWERISMREVRCCGLTACALDGGSKPELLSRLPDMTVMEALAALHVSLGIEPCYANGFMHAWDGSRPEIPYQGRLKPSEEEQFDVGFKDGTAAALAVFGWDINRANGTDELIAAED